MKKALLIINGLIIVALLLVAGTPQLGATAQAADTKVYKWVFAQAQQPNNTFFLRNKKEAKEIAKQTNGRLQIQVFSDGVIVPSMEIPNAVKNRTIEMGNTPYSAFQAVLPSTRMISFMGGPLMSLSDWMVWGNAFGYPVVKADIDKTFNARFYPGAALPAVLCSKKPVTKLSDYKGMKLRMYGHTASLARKLGASIVQVPGNELYTALQTGSIDGAFWGGYDGAWIIKMWEITKYYLTPVCAVGGAMCFIVNKDAYNELPGDLQLVVDEWLKKQQWLTAKESRQLEERGLDTMIQNGMKRSAMNAEDQAEIKRIALELLKDEAKDASSTEMYNSMVNFIRQDEKMWKPSFNAE